MAESAKVIEKTQRDINIALINELALIVKRLNIDTEEVLKAAGSKWNFLPFRPGLVGGHCIGVDPYYLTHKAMEVGYHPEIILSGRRLNDGMGKYVAREVINLMTKKRIPVVDSNILVMGLTFKEDCPDLRNTRVVDVIEELKDFHCNINVYDPWIDKEESEKEYDIVPIEQPEQGKYDAIIIAVSHHQFKAMGIDVWVERNPATPDIVNGEAELSAVEKEKPIVVSMHETSPPALIDSNENTEAEVTATTNVETLDWQDLRSHIAECQLCELSKTRKQTVFGSGLQTASLMIIGNAPNSEDEQQGENALIRQKKHTFFVMKSVLLGKKGK